MLALAAEIGVILLLFEVGLESNIDELMAVGASAMLVAMLGVIAPVVLGYGVSIWFLPEDPWYVHLFAGATLAATSVGITARVLKDMHKMETKEAKIILGAAVIDDVLGLIILAVVSGLVTSIGQGGGGSIDIVGVLMIIGKAAAFLAVSIAAGRLLAGKVLYIGSKAKVGGMPVVLSVCWCFVMAGLAETIGLAAIVGAFAAGLVLDQTHYQGYEELRRRHVEELLAPLSAIYVPVFFVLMGLRVDLRAFSSMSVLAFAAGLTVAAIIGKQVCSLGILEKGLNRIVVGVGMIPRGEVGLIFAGIGASLSVAGKPVFSSETFSAMIVMVILTTLATPPLLKALFAKKTATASESNSQA
jgi:Kef-type K+ transport system membrane component KefB